jgi:hypothetical protein
MVVSRDATYYQNTYGHPDITYVTLITIPIKNIAFYVLEVLNIALVIYL